MSSSDDIRWIQRLDNYERAVYAQTSMTYAPLFREFCEVMKRKKNEM